MVLVLKTLAHEELMLTREAERGRAGVGRLSARSRLGFAACGSALR